jgi:23S rRNA pseudouridine1911/1915/1917 synthase
MQEFKFSANAQDKGLRLDKFLVEKFAAIKPEISRSHIQNLIENNKITNARNQIILTSSSYKIKGDEELSVQIPPPVASEILAKDIAIDIVWQDENMMVVNKPAGLTTHPGNGNQQHTLVNALLFCATELSGINGVARPGIVHRLDKDTSGLMVVAKNDLAHQNLALQIQERKLKRNYLAVCYGVPKPLNGIIDKNLGRSKINRMKMGGKKAVTNYSVQKIYQNSLLSLVECRLDTGRTHQIRVHMTSIGHSLVGDQVYGGRKKSLNDLEEDLKNLVENFPRQALHSYKIAFLHPVTQAEMEFSVDMPEDMKELTRRLG